MKSHSIVKNLECPPQEVMYSQKDHEIRSNHKVSPLVKSNSYKDGADRIFNMYAEINLSLSLSHMFGT